MEANVVQRRLDGHKFEKEFSAAIENKYFLLRLHTPNTGYSGLTQPADFLVIGDKVSLVETKETTKDVFYISQMEQLDEMLDYLDQKFKLKGKTLKKSQYLVIVHFIDRKVIKVITGEYAKQLYENKKGFTYLDPEAQEFQSMKDLKENLIL